MIQARWKIVVGTELWYPIVSYSTKRMTIIIVTVGMIPFPWLLPTNVLSLGILVSVPETPLQ